MWKIAIQCDIWLPLDMNNSIHKTSKTKYTKICLSTPKSSPEYRHSGKRNKSGTKE